MDFGQVSNLFRQFGTRGVVESFRGLVDPLSDAQKITLFVYGLDRHKRRISDLTTVLTEYPTLFRPVCEELLPNVVVAPLFEFIPPEATIPGVSPEDYKGWYRNICERGIPLRPMEIKYVAQTPLHWYHQLCIAALQSEPESITEIPKTVLKDRAFVKRVASSPVEMKLKIYEIDEEEYAVPKHVIQFIKSVRDNKSFHVVTAKKPLHSKKGRNLPSDITGQIAEFFGGSRNTRRRKR